MRKFKWKLSVEKLFSEGKILEACDILIQARVKPPPEKLAEILAFGDQALKKKNFMTALKAYSIVFRQKMDLVSSEAAKKKILELGGICFKNLLLMHNIALNAFIIVSDKEKLIHLGDKSLEEGGVGTAFNAYKAAGAKEKLIELGKKIQENPSLTLSLSWTVQAEDAFKAAREIENKNAE